VSWSMVSWSLGRRRQGALPVSPFGLFGLRPVHALTLRLRRPRLLASLPLYTQRGRMGTSVGSASRFGSLVPRADQPHTAAGWPPLRPSKEDGLGLPEVERRGRRQF
jgi:hypothetical protein